MASAARLSMVSLRHWGEVGNFGAHAGEPGAPEGLMSGGLKQALVATLEVEHLDHDIVRRPWTAQACSRRRRRRWRKWRSDKGKDGVS